MRDVSLVTMVLGVVLSLSMVAPAQAQQAQGIWSGIDFSEAMPEPDLLARPGATRLADARSGGERTPPLLPRSIQSVEASSAARPNSAVHTVGGAIVGALIGSAILFAPSRCRQVESMCGAAIPLYAGGGAAIGGLLGYQYARNSGGSSFERH